VSLTPSTTDQRDIDSMTTKLAILFGIFESIFEKALYKGHIWSCLMKKPEVENLVTQSL
jgi:hypothetical protein